jgi:hypothetical protein
MRGEVPVEVPANKSGGESSPEKPHEADAGQPDGLPSLKRDYGWVENLGCLLWIVFMVVCTAGWTFLFIGLHRWRLAELPPSVFLIAPEAGWWSLPGGFLGFVTSYLLVASVAPRVLLGRRYPDYVEWARGKYQMEKRETVLRLVQFVRLFVFVPMAFFTALGMDCYYRFGENDIGINRFWGLGERTYSYAQVRHVVRTTHVNPLLGRVQERARLCIVFDDGHVWHNESTGRTDLQEDLKIIEFVCRKTGKRLREVKFIEDVTE